MIIRKKAIPRILVIKMDMRSMGIMKWKVMNSRGVSGKDRGV